jgi:hypothetical protein
MSIRIIEKEWSLESNEQKNELREEKKTIIVLEPDSNERVREKEWNYRYIIVVLETTRKLEGKKDETDIYKVWPNNYCVFFYMVRDLNLICSHERYVPVFVDSIFYCYYYCCWMITEKKDDGQGNQETTM